MSSRLRCKFFTCVLVFCCSFTALYAQLAVGAKGGVSFAQQNVNETPSGWRTTYQVGLVLNLYVAEFSFGGFGVQPELLFNNKGGTVQVADASQYWEGNAKLSYIEMPLGFIYLMNFGGVLPYISVAPYYAFLVSQKNEVRGQESSANNYKNSDYGIKFGGGIELHRFQISAAYSLGLCDISNSGKGVYNRGVEVSLGYFFLSNY